MRSWTERKVAWDRLLQIHHGIRPKPQGKPTVRLVVQMTGEHGYRRADAYKALARGLAGKLPASWKLAEENAAVEIWLTIHGNMAVCGLRLSDRTMRQRGYKVEHLPASLRPTVAAAMVRLAELKPGQTVVDPMCGAGTLLAETLEHARSHFSYAERAPDGSAGANRGAKLRVLGGDLDPHHVRAAQANLRRLGEVDLKTWDARRLPLGDESVDRILCNPPFGKQLGTAEEIGPLYAELARQCQRVLKPGGLAVLVVADAGPLREAARRHGWKQLRQIPLRILGQRAIIAVYRKASVVSKAL
jgi:23S rRNA G2445 N2-methylase RlmL